MAQYSNHQHPIRAARVKKGLTQQALAAAVGVTNSAISRFESSIDRPSPEIAIRIGDVLRMTLDQVYDRKRAA